MSSRKLKAVLFDMGSTLIEFENSTWDILGKACAANGYEFLRRRNLNLPGFEEFSELLNKEFLKARSEVQDNLGEFRVEKVALNFFGVLNLSTSDGLYHSFLEVYYKPISDQLTLIDGAEDVLKYFKEKNLRIGLVSNTIFPASFHLKELRRFGLYPYLDGHLFSSQVGVRKPHPQIFVQALDELNTHPSNAVFVGDRLVEDVGGAQNVGMKGILRHHENRDYSAAITPDARIDHLNDLPEAVLSLFAN
ncbi:MAG: HAD-IA family hydrolase [candidate division Zixibacteria bacterium]|nr:HAD-IA family hydrolase [candidate division Zixibacteria bacterium]